MKTSGTTRLLLGAILCGIVVVSAFVGGWWIRGPNRRATSHLEVDESQLDFGTAYAQDRFLWNLDITNRSSELASISAFRSSPDANAAEVVTLDRMISTWLKRSATCDDLYVEWEGVMVVPKKLQSEDRPSNESDEDVRIPFRNVVKWRGHKVERFYYWTDLPMRNSETGELDQQTQTTIVNGDTEAQILDIKRNQSFLEGSLDASDFMCVTVPSLRPFVLTFRLLNSEMGGHDRSTFRLTEEIGVVEGQECHVVALVDETGRRVHELLVDPAREYSIRRYRLYYPDGAPWQQIDVEYVKHHEFGWVPNTWTVFTLDEDGQRIDYHEHKLKSIYVNANVSEADFSIEFPPRTLVTDRRQRARTSYFVEDDGTHRPVTKDEKLALYSSAMKDVFPSLKDHAREPAKTGRVWYIIGGALLLVAALAIPIVLKRRQIVLRRGRG